MIAQQLLNPSPRYNGHMIECPLDKWTASAKRICSTCLSITCRFLGYQNFQLGCAWKEKSGFGCIELSPNKMGTLRYPKKSVGSFQPAKCKKYVVGHELGISKADSANNQDLQPQFIVSTCHGASPDLLDPCRWVANSKGAMSLLSPAATGEPETVVLHKGDGGLTKKNLCINKYKQICLMYPIRYAPCQRCCSWCCCCCWSRLWSQAAKYVMTDLKSKFGTPTSAKSMFDSNYICILYLLMPRLFPLQSICSDWEPPQDIPNNS